MRTLLIIAIVAVLSACTSTYQFTYTRKSGIEQLLVSTAVDRAVQMMTADIKGTKVFVDVASLMRDEQPYVRKSLIHWLLGAGVSISENQWDADYTVSVLVKVAGTDGDQVSLGIPSIPIPFSIGITTPALTLLSQINQRGRVDMEVVIYSSRGEIKEKIPSLKGSSYYKKYVIMFIPFTRKDIP